MSFCDLKHVFVFVTMDDQRFNAIVTVIAYSSLSPAIIENNFVSAFSDQTHTYSLL